jgi:hypothetical protein
LVSDPIDVNGTIRGIQRNNGSTPIPFDHVVLAAWGSKGDALISRINNGDIQVGDEVHITQEITDCDSDPEHDWSKTYASIGGDYHFLRGGVYYAPNNNDATWPNSRTVVAYNAAYVYFIVVDAFDENVSEGITVPELTGFLRDTLAATDAVSLDSGTSSTMVVNGVVVNNTYCNFTRDCGMQNSFEITRPGNNIPSSAGAIQWSTADNQAYVGNGLMMVVVDGKTLSGAFNAGQPVVTTTETSLRLGPGTNYADFSTIYPGAHGVIEAHDLDGVMAKGFCWWKVAVGGMTGWVKEGALLGESLPPVPLPQGDFNLFLPIIKAVTAQARSCLVR